MSLKAKLDAEFQAAAAGAKALAGGDHCVTAARVTTAAPPRREPWARGPVSVEVATRDLVREDGSVVQRAGDWRLVEGSFSEHRLLTAEEVEAMLAGATDVRADVYRVISTQHGPNSISFGWVTTSGPPGDLRYTHGVDRRYRPDYSSRMPTQFATAAEAIADAVRTAECDPLWDRPALVGENAWMGSGGDVHDHE